MRLIAYARLLLIPPAVWAVFEYLALGYDYVVEGHGLHPAACAVALVMLSVGMVGLFSIDCDE